MALDQYKILYINIYKLVLDLEEIMTFSRYTNLRSESHQELRQGKISAKYHIHLFVREPHKLHVN